jgi:hypothetical protein
MICYTLKGRGHSLEIHQDKLLLLKRPWFLFFLRPVPKTWKISELARFEMVEDKIEWRCTEGVEGSLQFYGNPEEIKKIEQYLQKKVEKNATRPRPGRNEKIA